MTNLQLRQQVGGRCPALSYTRQPVHVSQGRADITVAQQVLQLVNRQPRFQHVGRIGMSQAVNAALSMYPGAKLGLAIYLLDTGRMEGSVRHLVARKQPTLWSAQLPVNPQMLQQRIRESNRTVLGSLALRDPQQVPLAVDVADPELAQLTDPQAAAVADLQHHLVLAVGASRQYPGDLRSGQQLRYALGLLRYRESHFQLIALEHLHQQKADVMKRVRTARCGELSPASKVRQVPTDLVLIKPVWRLAIVLGQALNRLQIGLVGSRGKATHLHGGDHLLPKGCHLLFPHTVGGNKSLAPNRGNRRDHSAPRSGLVQRRSARAPAEWRRSRNVVGVAVTGLVIFTLQRS